MCGHNLHERPSLTVGPSLLLTDSFTRPTVNCFLSHSVSLTPSCVSEPVESSSGAQPDHYALTAGSPTARVDTLPTKQCLTDLFVSNTPRCYTASHDDSDEVLMLRSYIFELLD